MMVQGVTGAVLPQAREQLSPQKSEETRSLSVGAMVKQQGTSRRDTRRPHRPLLTSENHLPRSTSLGVSIHENRRP